MIDLELTYDEAYQFIKLYDILRDMDMPLTEKQMNKLIYIILMVQPLVEY